MQKLTTEEIELKLQELNGWKFKDNGLEKDFLLKDFSETFALMTRIALLSEKNDHHPEWSNVYNKLHVRLSTHDAGGVTRRDTDMAMAIEGMVQGKK